MPPTRELRSHHLRLHHACCHRQLARQAELSGEGPTEPEWLDLIIAGIIPKSHSSHGGFNNSLPG
jgi:hypothetical protein